MTPMAQDLEQKRSGPIGGGVGSEAARAVSSEGLLEDPAGGQLGPRDAWSPRRSPGMHRHTMSSWGSEGTLI